MIGDFHLFMRSARRQHGLQAAAQHSLGRPHERRRHPRSAFRQLSARSTMMKSAHAIGCGTTDTALWLHSAQAPQEDFWQ